jgi:hypothetical protein
MDKENKKVKIFNLLLVLIGILCTSLAILVISTGIFGLDLEANTLIEFGDEINNKDESLKQDRTFENVEGDDYLYKFEIDSNKNSQFLKNYNKK